MSLDEANDDIAGLFERMANEPAREAEIAAQLRERLSEMRKLGVSLPVDFVVLEAQLESAWGHGAH